MARFTAASTYLRVHHGVRPQRNASRFISTDTPFSRMARSMDSAEMGSAPAWYATPIMMGFVAMWSSKSASAMAMAST